MRRLLTLAAATFLRPSVPQQSLSSCFPFSGNGSVPTPPPPNQRMYTTNEEDQREAARLKARLEENKDSVSGGEVAAAGAVPNVTLAEGAHKYVLISALTPNGGERQHFVVSRRHAAYHRNAAEPMVEALERSGYSSISILGGGRVALDERAKTISIYGFSYGFGLPDHEISKAVVAADPRYKGFEITTSNEGY